MGRFWANTLFMPSNKAPDRVPRRLLKYLKSGTETNLPKRNAIISTADRRKSRPGSATASGVWIPWFSFYEVNHFTLNNPVKSLWTRNNKANFCFSLPTSEPRVRIRKHRRRLCPRPVAAVLIKNSTMQMLKEAECFMSTPEFKF